MSFRLRPAAGHDVTDLHSLATSLSARGFLTLPSEPRGLKQLVGLSEKSFSGKLEDPDQGEYLFVLEDLEKQKVIGCSLIIARHGTPDSPHIFFEVNAEKGTIQLRQETTGRTELGGLILDPAYRGHPEKLGKRLSYVRLLYSGRHQDRFRRELLAELKPPLTPSGQSPLWEALGRCFTGMDYREADERSRRDKGFVSGKFPAAAIPISSLPPDAQAALGAVGPETRPVAGILEQVGFRYLNQVDPFDGGPHFGARLDEIKFGAIAAFLGKATKVKVVCP